jgi:hypothetical protein
VWSFDDNLFTENTKHWAGQNMTMVGAISVDGKAYQFMGNSAEFASANALQQQQKIVMPTSTYYQFVTPEKIELIVVFTSIVDQVNNEAELQRPYAYVTVSVNNSDSVNHEVKVYYEVLSDWVLDVNFDNDGQIGWAPLTGADPAHWVANVIRNYDDVPFSEKGDYIKMNWGLMFMATLPDNRVSHTVSSASAARTSFALNASLPGDDLTGVRDYPSDTVGSAFVWSFGELAPQATTGSYMVIGYDDIFSMDYFGEWQRPLWTKQWNGDLHAMILDGINSWQALLARTSLFDRILFAQLRTAGGDAYSLITALAYRQVTAGIKGVWSDVKNESRWYMKEISSDGDISTVDVIYPASPFFIQFAPEILRKMLLPLLDYAINATDIAYNLPWAPHHLGFWPVCDITPGQQEQMPMEESGNFFLMVAGIVQQQKSTVWLQPYWSVMATWSEYLISALPDPGNQLCTDDFEGPSPHNVNLALKGIVGLNAYAQILAADGQQAASAKAAAAAAGFAQQWLKMAQDPNGGNHTLLQFNEPGTFSMKVSEGSRNSGTCEQCFGACVLISILFPFPFLSTTCCSTRSSV